MSMAGKEAPAQIDLFHLPRLAAFKVTGVIQHSTPRDVAFYPNDGSSSSHTPLDDK